MQNTMECYTIKITKKSHSDYLQTIDKTLKRMKIIYSNFYLASGKYYSIALYLLITLYYSFPSLAELHFVGVNNLKTQLLYTEIIYC